MKKIFMLVLAIPVFLTACAPAKVSPYAYDGKQRSVVGEFCPPKEAIKGNC